MKKICFIISRLSNLGPVNVLYDIVLELNKNKDYDLTIVTIFKEGQQSKIKDFKKIDGIEIKSLNFEKISDFLFGIKKIKEAIKKINPNIIHGHCIWGGIFLKRFKDKKIKKVFTVHSYFPLSFELTRNRIKAGLMTYLYFNFLKSIDKVVCCGKSIKELFEKNYGKNYDYIENGIAEIEDSCKKNELREILGILKEDKVFIVIGSLDSRKNPLFVLDSFKKFNIKYPQTKLIFLGDGPYLKEIENKKTKNIYILGKVKNVREYLEIADYYISASLNEGLPLAVIEAMRSKIPVILSKIPPHEEIVEETIYNKENLFDLNKENDLFYTLEKIVKNCNTYKNMSEEAYFRFKQNFTSKIMTNKYIKLYEEL